MSDHIDKNDFQKIVKIDEQGSLKSFLPNSMFNGFTNLEVGEGYIFHKREDQLSNILGEEDKVGVVSIDAFPEQTLVELAFTQKSTIENLDERHLLESIL